MTLRSPSIQTTAAVGTVIHHGQVFDFKNWNPPPLSEVSPTTTNTRHTPMEAELQHQVEALFAALEAQNLDYLLVGGIALLTYVEGRNTQDIDFILPREALAQLPELVIESENRDFLRGQFGVLPVDILLTQNRLFQRVLQDFWGIRSLGDRAIRCVTVEGLVLLKLYALPSLYHQEQFNRVSLYENDILLLLLNYSIDVAPLLAILKQEVLGTDLESIEEILVDIQGRLRRFDRSRFPEA